MNRKFFTPQIIPLESKVNSTGKLTFFEGMEDFPFHINRSFWISGVPEGANRGVHAHKKETQLLICLQGIIRVELEDLSKTKFSFDLSDADHALFIPPMTWSSVCFGSDVLLLVLSDQQFDEEDYIRSKEEFQILQRRHLKENTDGSK
jgi:dTDP-4-dehydrorhamnose 3,5-epimerase-like enzyme